MSMELHETQADLQIRNCLDNKQSFSMIAGAGSGKTTSLIAALKHLRKIKGSRLRRDDKKIACITYTNRAVEIISSRLDWDELYCVSTIHSFLWGEINRFTPNIRDTLIAYIIPKHIEKKQTDDNGGQSIKAIAARERIASLQSDLESLENVNSFTYTDTNFSNYPGGKLNHNDVIDIAAYLLSENEILRRIVRQKYPYIFVDEAQDTFENVVEALNKICEGNGLPIVGYFGDPMQQIYDKRAGNFAGPDNSVQITKEENYRCSCQVINLLNAFRQDVQQYPAGENANVEGSVFIRLVPAESPNGTRNRYTEEQTIRASAQFEEALNSWGWQGKEDITQLFLVRQMIARRLGFPKLQDLFTGKFASKKTQEDYEKGEHFLIKPFVNFLWPLVQAQQNEDFRRVIDILTSSSPAFDHRGINTNRTLREMREIANKLTQGLSNLWGKATTSEILKFCQNNNLYEISERLSEHLERAPREEEYDSTLHSSEKSDWLADSFFQMPTNEIESFVEFINGNTPLSTQHGVKGEEYKDVVVVFDDTDAAWTTYSFTKMLTPNTSGIPTEGQLRKSKKLAYVCFSRAKENLRILLFTPNPRAAKEELISNNLFQENQVVIAD